MTNPLASNADKIEIGDMVEVLRCAPYHYPRGAHGKVVDIGERGTRVYFKIESDPEVWVIDRVHVAKVVWDT